MRDRETETGRHINRGRSGPGEHTHKLGGDRSGVTTIVLKLWRVWVVEQLLCGGSEIQTKFRWFERYFSTTNMGHAVGLPTPTENDLWRTDIPALIRQNSCVASNHPGICFLSLSPSLPYCFVYFVYFLSFFFARSFSQSRILSLSLLLSFSLARSLALSLRCWTRRSGPSTRASGSRRTQRTGSSTRCRHWRASWPAPQRPAASSSSL